MSKTPRTSKKSTSTKKKKTKSTTKSKKPKIKKEVVSHWTGPKANLEKYEGFVYLIENLLTGKLYIGRKYLWSTRRIKVEGKKRRTVVRQESNWKTYTSSSKDLNADIKLLGKENFSFKILSFYETKGKTNYAEVKEQFTRDVLNSKNEDGEYLYYNTNILSRYFRGNI